MKSIYRAVLVAFGDSITAGIGVPEGAPKWTDTVRDRFGLKLINAGIGGNTSAQGLARLEDDVICHRPDFVTISFGMNDHCLLVGGEPRVSLPDFKANLAEMIQRIKGASAVPLLVTTNYIIEGDREHYYYSRHDPELYKGDVGGAQAWLDRYMAVVRQLAEEESVGLIDVREACGKYDPYEFLRSLKNSEFMDGVHPHVLGAQVYASLIGDYLEVHFGVNGVTSEGAHEQTRVMEECFRQNALFTQEEPGTS